MQRRSGKQEYGCSIRAATRKEERNTKREEEDERERERKRDSRGKTGARARRRRLQQVVKYERRVVRLKHHLCLSIKFTRLSFQHCAGCHFVSPISVSYSRTDSLTLPHRAPATIPSVVLLVSFPFVLLAASLATELTTSVPPSFSPSVSANVVPSSLIPLPAFSLAIARCYTTRYELPAINVKTFASPVPALPTKLATYPAVRRIPYTRP